MKRKVGNNSIQPPWKVVVEEELKLQPQAALVTRDWLT
jgi:hypothetical protein